MRSSITFETMGHLVPPTTKTFGGLRSSGMEISHPKVAPGQRAGTVCEEVLPESYEVECWDAL